MNEWMADGLAWLKGACRHNVALKLLSLALAALSYYAIHGATSFEVSYQVPLEVKVERGIAVLDQDVQTVDVVFRGSQQDILLLDERQLRAVVKRRAGEPSGSESVPVGPSNIEGEKGVKVVRVRPSQVMLTFDREGERTVAVARPQTVGKPLVGKVEMEYEPRTVVLRGPERRLKEKDIVFTEPVDIEGRVGSFTRRLRVLPPSDAWRPEIEPADITVRVTIAADSVSRQLTNVPVLVMVRPGADASLAADPPLVTVSLQGRAELLGRLDPELIQVFVDLRRGLPEAGGERALDVHLPVEFEEVTATVTPAAVRMVNKPVTGE